jgi:hypothetical protein
MGQANVKRRVPDILPLLDDDDVLGVDTFATHTLPLDEAPDAYEMFQEKKDGAVKVVLKPFGEGLGSSARRSRASTSRVGVGQRGGFRRAPGEKRGA